MKTIEERTREFMDFSVSSLYSEKLAEIRKAFIAGAESEHEELTKWNDPKDHPSHEGPVLVKLKNGKYHVVNCICNHYILFGDPMAYDHLIVGWREINA